MSFPERLAILATPSLWCLSAISLTLSEILNLPGLESLSWKLLVLSVPFLFVGGLCCLAFSWQRHREAGADRHDIHEFLLGSSAF